MWTEVQSRRASVKCQSGEIILRQERPARQPARVAVSACPNSGTGSVQLSKEAKKNRAESNEHEPEVCCVSLRLYLQPVLFCSVSII